MNTIEVQMVSLTDGRTALKYPVTPTWFWNMEGYYVPSSSESVLVKLTAEQVDLLVPEGHER